MASAEKRDGKLEKLLDCEVNNDGVYHGALIDQGDE
jgi:hypothetical protein